MPPERLEWLPLSLPPAPPVPKITVAGAAPCPHCGWPVAAEATCAQCGYRSDQEGVTDPVAALQIELLPRVIEVTSAPEHWFDHPSLDSPAMYDLRLQAERLRVTSGFDRLICLDDISVDHYSYQLDTALRALRDMRGRALLADEVGLGKTIEAGIVMKELIERGLVTSVLILTPASLTWQWHEEMQAKFHETFTVLESLADLAPAAPCRWIVSLDRAKSGRWADQLLAREYDLLIVDEAHKLRNHRTDAYHFVNQIRKRYVLMVTATPIHNDLMELYNLVTILRPGHLGTRQAFRRNFVASPAVSEPPARRPGLRTVYSSPGAPAYLRKSQEARQAYRQQQVNMAWILNRTENLADLDNLKYLDRRGRQAIAEIRQLLAQDYEVVDFEAIEWRYWAGWRKLRHDFVCRLKLKPQSRPARSSRPQLERRTSPHNPAALRGLLQELMIRNRRRSVSVRFPPRQAAVYYLNLTPPERELYDGVTAYIREQLSRETEGVDRRSAGALRMTLMTLQKALCSSPQAVAQTLEKRVAGQADPRLAEYLLLARSIAYGRKVEATRIILEQYPGKFLIFTDYLPTLHALQAALAEAGQETIIFHGGMSAYERLEAVRTFRQSARVMLSTQSGSEGHNLQFCQQMINYDLPWNPMRIEQRIGRIHRLGQQHPVTIFNLSATHTIEAYILDLLAHKIRMFELVIGELDLILGELAGEHSFEDYLEAAWAGSQSEAELLQMIAELEALLGQSQTTYQQIRTVSDELSELLDA